MSKTLRFLRLIPCRVGLHWPVYRQRLEYEMPTGGKVTFEHIKLWLGPVIYTEHCLCCRKELARYEDWDE